MLLAFIDSGMQNNLQEGADLLKEQQSLHVYIERYLKKKKKKINRRKHLLQDSLFTMNYYLKRFKL